MTFPKYPEYKDSGVEWLGEVPAHWFVGKLKWHASVSSGTDGRADRGDVPLYGANGVIGFSDGFSYSSPKVLVGRVGSSGAVNFASGRFSVSDNALVVDEAQAIDVRYLHFWATTQDFSIDVSTTAQPLLTASQVKDFCLPLPPPEEQGEIAAFLDHETGKIDALIEEQRRLIELLKEKRQAVISHAINDHGSNTQGRLGYYIDLLPGYAFSSQGFRIDGGIRLLRGINVGVGKISWNEAVFWPKEEIAGLEEYFLREGDLVLGMDRPWIGGGARVAKVSREDLPALLLQRVARIRPKNGLDQEFLWLVLASQEFKRTLEAELTGVSVPHVSSDQIRSFRISLPDIESQSKILMTVRTELEKIGSLTEQCERGVELMEERKTSLISAAVTGRIDVRGWSAGAEPYEPEWAMAAEEPAGYSAQGGAA
ncbi:restriction endonuclease subunit S [Thioalkalivibrio sp. ALJT]|uniref:restriction endonuclease subunit S n=1 Tax=Thioalkalivibrio sp. ALJT TaxID=1158146 RepID=UPI0009D9674C|nr:restriction endonuclease subunit S [Thioalkalivibrio sp. ALJT]